MKDGTGKFKAIGKIPTKRKNSSGVKSVKQRIAASVIFVVVVSLLVLGFFSVAISYTSVSDLMEDMLSSTAEIAAQRVEWELMSYRNISSEVGAIPEMADPGVSVSYKTEILNERVKEYDFERGNIIGADGKSLLDGTDYSEREYFKEAMKGNSCISEPLVSKITGKLTIIVSAPLWKDGIVGGESIGAVYFVPHEEFLNDIMRDIKTSENTIAYMIDKDGNTIADVDTEVVISGENVEELAKTQPKLYAECAKMHEAARNGEKGIINYKYKGERCFSAYTSVENTDGWSIIVETPNDDVLGETKTSILITLVIMVLAIILSTLTAKALGARIGKPVVACTERIEKLAMGDLTSAVEIVNTNDEMEILSKATKKTVDALNKMIEDISYMLTEMSEGNFNVDSRNRQYYIGDFEVLLKSVDTINNKLSDTLSQINTAAEQVSGGADQIAAGAQALSQGATEQAASSEELSATLHDISEHVTDNSKNCDHARDLVDATMNNVLEANEKMDNLSQAMNEINETSDKIGKIIKVIENISFQTNILALNAAVEAATAGEAGKGFAVVAEEVRSLAEKSSEAAQSTATLIAQSVDAVKNGVEITTETAEAINNVKTQATEVDEIVGKIADASDKQAVMLAQATDGIEQISVVVQTNSATAEESAAASEELSGQSAMLKDLVHKFKLKG